MDIRPAASFALLLGVLASSSLVVAQDAQRPKNDPSKSIPASRYAVLSKQLGPGGPAPKHDVNGVWAGPLEAERGEVPAMTPLGQKLFSMNKTERKDGWAHANDPWKTCDPFGVPRSAVNEIRGISFAPLPNKIVVLHQYNRIWREVWMDGRALPKNVISGHDAFSYECRGQTVNTLAKLRIGFSLLSLHDGDTVAKRRGAAG